jgi:molecular chaperone DnaK
MVQDAEANADADKQARELIDAKNSGEQQLHDIRKNLSEHGDKITEEQRTKIDAAITALETAMAGDDATKITEAVGQLFEPVMPLYEAARAAEQPAAETNTAANSDDGVVNAEFTEVKKDA